MDKRYSLDDGTFANAALCPEFSQAAFGAKTMRGHLYILSNRAMPNLLKIGYTTRTVKERMQELSSTGVPGKFEAEFYCEVDNAPGLEKAIHSRLSRHRYHKEFFRCNLELAVRIAKETLLERGYSVFGSGGRSSHIFITDQEKAAMRNAEEERHQYEIAASREKDKRDKKINSLEEQFMQLAPPVEKAIRNHCALGKHEPMKTIAGFALALTGVGILLLDKISPPACDDGLNTARKLPAADVSRVREFFKVVQELRSLDALSAVAEKYFENARPEDRYLICHEYGRYDMSSLVGGVFHGLGLTPVK